ncbi:Zn-dependent oligopeptidase [Novosphingobium flavum]|uniref:Zn-dependent oligopeptidase n=1 Tax=Novosphingobium flavum TaxID=1778672 RepID=A0A7X1KKM2_9SPHN|nr:M3 family metallopeptidase [Novosphingobium flavum]MBC2664691.1 Zn-dependent oligopeptidase [Novosphingobium flavum]
MRRSFAPALLACSVLAGSAEAAPLRPNGSDLFAGAILGNPQDAGTISRRCDAYLAEIARRQAVLENGAGAATVHLTLQTFDDVNNLLIAAAGEFALYREASADAARREAGSACEVKVAAANTRLNLSRKVYDRLKAIPAAKADPATRLYLTRSLGGFERSGVALPAAQRKRAQDLQDKISAAGAAFDREIANGRKTVSADPAELEGLPPDFIAAHKPGPDGKVTISTDYPDLFPVLSYARSEGLRRKLYEANLTRAWPANDANLRVMLDLRQQFAALLGRKDHATLVLEDKMLDRPAKVEGLLTEMAAAARPAAARDYARKLAVYQMGHPGATSFNAWDNAWLSQQVQKRDFAYDRQEARQYFAYDNVRDGILRLTESLFGVTIRPWRTTTWDSSVEAYEMFEGRGANAGKLIGRFYFDSHPRPGKYNHANMINLRQGLAGRAVPVGVLVMNLPEGGHATGLMEHGDVETFLHEFGHMLHHIFGGQAARWAGLSGVSTEWDFVEAPSQMLEEWVYDYDTLAKFAVNAKGETIPRALVEKMNAARYFDLGMTDMRQLALSNISLRLHQGPAPADLGARTRQLDAEYDALPLPAFAQQQDSFGHLNGYSAVYYTYRWSKVIADDMFTRFAKAGLRDPATALAYRRKVLEPGGSKPAAQLVADFLGRPISIDAYKAEMAKDR